MKDEIFLRRDRVRKTAFALQCGVPKLEIRSMR